ncbi:MAG: hypothetical protein ABEJ44_05530 [Halanaeroarchaeum sp.]
MDFRDDDRAQSVQVGAILLFAVLVILLATYQTTVVPNDNQSAEFDHSLDVRQDMLEVRNAIYGAYETGETNPTTVTLGTTYPLHTFGVNPPPVSGTLYTTGGGTISVERGNGNTADVCPGSAETKRLQYEADYNYYTPAPTLVYENTILYADYGDNRTVMISDQLLVTGDTVNLIALQGNYSENGIAATGFTPQAGSLRVTPITDPTISVPTALPEDRWENLLSANVDDPEDDVKVTNGMLTVSLEGQYDVRCSVIGADSPPPGGLREDQNAPEINPAGPDDVQIDAILQSPGDVSVDFNNTADTAANITRARIAFYYSEQHDLDSMDITDLETGETYVGFQELDPMRTLDPPITIDANSVKRLRFDIDTTTGNPKGDYFVLQLEFADGRRGTYFISVPAG